MRGSVLVTVIATVLTLCGAQTAGAQEAIDEGRSRQSPESRQEASPPRSSVIASRSWFGVWAAHSVASGAVLGSVPDSRLSAVALRYSRVLLPTPRQDPTAFGGPVLLYTVDLVPVTRLHIPEDARPERFFPEGSRQGAFAASGVGSYPVGLRLTFRPRTRVRPFVAGQAGLLYFAETVPDERGRQLNFAAGIGTGLQILFSRGLSLTAGYRYHHLSNGFRGSINPGLDANLLYLGVETGL